MSAKNQLVLPLVLLAAAAAGAFYFLQRTDAPVVGPPTGTQAPQPEQPPPTTTPETAPPVAAPQDPVRTAVTGAGSTAHSDAPQGVRGRVVQPGGTPVEGCEVLLVESAMNDPIQIFLRNQMGQTTPPVARAVTGADGNFALGIRQPGKMLDLRVVSVDFPELMRRQLKIHDGDWLDLRDIELDLGRVVQGRVVDSLSKTPIANATVFLAGSQQAHAIVATPGRERGVPTTTDANGNFRFACAPRTGTVNLAAEAPGYATAQVLNQHLRDDGPTELTIEVDQGQPLGGIVVDQQGGPVANARITAMGLSAKTPQTDVATSGTDGRFEFPCLRNGPYSLTITAPQHADHKVPLALSGDTDVKVVLTSRGAVKLRVLGADHRPVKACRISLKSYFEANPQAIGNVPGFADRNINPSDYPTEYNGEWALIRGLPSGSFRFQITEARHAKSLSPHFTVVEGGDPIEVTAVLTLGASISGKVVDDAGRPVANAVVSTDMDSGIAADSGIFELFRTMIPEKHTSQQTRTGTDGTFQLNRLAFADYMLRVAHPDYCEGTRLAIKLQQEGEVVDAGTIQLTLGAIVEGTTTTEGRPIGQVKVVVSVPFNPETLPTANAPGQRQQVMFSANVLSDADGRFRLLKRVPPGTYKVTAARHTPDSPFNAMLDMKQTERQIVVGPGQDRLELHFDLPRR